MALLIDYRKQWAIDYAAASPDRDVALAQASGDAGPAGVVAQATREIGGGWTRCWSRWSNGKIEYTDNNGAIMGFPHYVGTAPGGLRWIDTTTLRPVEEP